MFMKLNFISNVMSFSKNKTLHEKCLYSVPMWEKYGPEKILTKNVSQVSHMLVALAKA